MIRLAAIVLAAGLSRRFGAERKLLADLGGRPLIDWAFAPLASLDLARRILVVPEGAPGISARGKASGFEIIVNPKAEDGMGSSLALGAQALDDVDGVFVALADMPFIPPAAYAALRAAFETGGPETIVLPMHEGRRGHPVLFGRAWVEALAALAGDQGAKGIIQRARDHLRPVTVAEDGILFDVDTPADLAAATARLAASKKSRQV